MKKNIAVFLDRDGTINEEVGYLDSLVKLKIIPGAFEAVRLINAAGMKAVVITNQSGVARGLFSEEFVKIVNEQLRVMLGQENAFIDGFYYCPHHPTEGVGHYRQECDCRKPAAGMLLRAAREMNINLEESYIIGDRYKDMEAGKRVGTKCILVKTGFGRSLLQDDGPDKLTPENKPDHVAADILEAVQWIMRECK
ncbi:MAG: HAD family hydrolase [Smithellaceae bacterium]|jgi:D,D-heptose 1,7-bisphosphate phosphatase|nr:HAD family hydrolase [Smithellaceae bacterium]